MPIRAATPADIPFIMEMERLPGRLDHVGRWEAGPHAEAMARADHAYFIGLDSAGQPIGFAMLQELDEPNGNVLFRRIAVQTRGQGDGRALFRAVRDWVFQETTAHRLYLHVYRHNERAFRAYIAAGFVEEGAAREARLLSDGRRVDVITLAMLRREWEVRAPSAA